jgi:ubiquitin carboxyl-terminal hydrolase L5
MTSSWCTIESDPGVFTELISSIGISGVQVEELYDLDLSHLSQLAPIHGLIFLFKWQSEAAPTADDVADSAGIHRTLAPHAEHVFFAKQIVNNACATQAILNVLFNRADVALGDEMNNFKDFTLSLPPDLRGEAIGASELIRTAHNSFARADPFVNEEKRRADDEEEDAFHFIGYVPVDGVLYELDGLQSAPISLGTVNADDQWLTVARTAIQSRVDKYAAKEIRFNLLAIVKDRRAVYEEQLTAIRAKRSRLTDPAAMTDSSAQSQLAQVDADEREVSALIADETVKFARWTAENVRRKHNYLPFVYQLLRKLAKDNKLQPLIQAAAKDTAERNERIKAAAAAAAATSKKTPVIDSATPASDTTTAK